MPLLLKATAVPSRCGCFSGGLAHIYEIHALFPARGSNQHPPMPCCMSASLGGDLLALNAPALATRCDTICKGHPVCNAHCCPVSETLWLTLIVLLHSAGHLGHTAVVASSVVEASHGCQPGGASGSPVQRSDTKGLSPTSNLSKTPSALTQRGAVTGGRLRPLAQPKPTRNVDSSKLSKHHTRQASPPKHHTEHVAHSAEDMSQTQAVQG